MKILYVTYSNPWEPKYGGSIRSYNVIRGLAKNHEVSVVLCTTSHDHARSFLNGAGSLDLHVIGASGDDVHVPGSEWSTSRVFLSMIGRHRFHEEFLQLLETVRPDVVWLFEKETMRRVSPADSIPIVLDLCDVQWRKLLRTSLQRKGLGRIKALAKVLPCFIEDRWSARKADISLVASPEEKNLVGSSGKVFPLPNGFVFPDGLSITDRDSKRVLFFGSLFYEPNLDGIMWFCSKIWPMVRKRLPNAVLDVVGLSQHDLSARVSATGVTFHGFCDDLDDMIRQAAFLIVPLRIAGGTRLKILEAWAKGLPVVSTRIGAEGLGVMNGQTALIADTPTELSEACIRLLESPREGRELAEKAYEYGKTHYDWECIFPLLEQVLGRVVSPTALRK